MAEDPDVVEELRWAWYVDQLAEAATMNLEHTVEQLDDDERLANARDEETRKWIRSQIVGRARMRIADLMNVRARVRERLLLPEKVADGG